MAQLSERRVLSHHPVMRSRTDLLNAGDYLVELLRALGERMPVYAFSNTNVAHQRFWERHYAAALEHFRAIFVSCELGLRKPEAEAFLRVSDVIGADPERILFFDDTRENVDGARAIGMSAVHVRDAADVRVSVSAFLE